MKKHHIFLLIISCLIAASFMFPTTILQTNPTPLFDHDAYPKKTTQPAGLENEAVYQKPMIIAIENANSMPTHVLPGDILHIAIKQDQLSSVQNNELSEVKLFSVSGSGKLTQIGGQIVPPGTNRRSFQLFTTKLIQNVNDDTPEVYLEIIMPKFPGTYELTYVLNPTYGQFAVTHPSTQTIVKHTIEVMPLTPANIEKIRVNGDNGI